ALKYSPESGTVYFRAAVAEKNVHVIVTDEGVGIPKAQMTKIFDRFYRVDKARSRRLGGTGLGLAIARETIQAHGGDIWVQSEPKKGTSIHFTLPLPEEKEEYGYELGNV